LSAEIAKVPFDNRTVPPFGVAVGG